MAVTLPDGKVGQYSSNGSSHINFTADTSSNSLSSLTASQHLDTLDEPISTTLLRDLRLIGVKIRHVLLPTSSTSSNELKNWDLWGPLLLCLILAITLSYSSPSTQSASIFAAVFVIVWLGAGIVTLNAALLGGNISFLQSVCVLGYCIAPLNIASILCHVYHATIFQAIVVIIAFVWSTKASVGFMSQLVPEQRKALAVYPVFLFYVTIVWMVLVQ